MDFPEEDDFNAEFQARLTATRLGLKWTYAKMAFNLGIPETNYKKLERRERAAFPLYLLPRLIFVTDKPYSYWMAGHGEAPPRFRVVK